MTVTGGDPADEPTRVDREPPSFPRVDDSTQTRPTPGAPVSPLFSAHDDPHADLSGAQTSAIVSRPLDPASGGSASGNSGGGSRLRWVVAAIATILVFTLVGGVLFLAAPHSGTPGLAAHYAPANTSAYVELRLDMPGDQKTNLAEFASHFPGFADQAAFQQKIDETLNSMLSRSGAGLDWNNDVKPWFGGQIGLFGDFGGSTSLSGLALGSSTDARPASPVVVLSVSDKAKLQAVLDAHAGSSQVASTDYQGQSIKTIAQPAGTSMSGSYVVTDDALIAASDIDQIKKALDVKAGTGDSLANDTYFLQQLGALHADRLATFYYDASKLISAETAALPSSMMPAQCMQMMQAQTNVKFVGEVRAEGDHMAFNVRSQLPSGDNAPPAPTNHQTNLAQTMPKDTVVYLEVHNLGDTLGWAIKNLLSCASSIQASGSPGPSGGSGVPADPSKIFEQLAGAKPEEYLDFIDDAALGVSYTNDAIGVGLVATVDDEATAKARVNKVLGLLQLAGGGLGGGSGGSQISTEESDHNGTTVTTIKVASPMMSDGGDVSLQVAVANGHFYMGLEDFVTAALDRQSGDSLASNPRYQKATSAAPAETAGMAYLDIAALAAAYEERLPESASQDFNTNTKPFLEPLSSLSFIGRVDNGVLVSNMNLFVE